MHEKLFYTEFLIAWFQREHSQIPKELWGGSKLQLVLASAWTIGTKKLLTASMAGAMQDMWNNCKMHSQLHVRLTVPNQDIQPTDQPINELPHLLDLSEHSSLRRPMPRGIC